MRDSEGSNTALGVSTVRAVHQIVDDLPHILEDPVSPLLLDAATQEGIRNNRERFGSAAARGLRSHVVLRSRFAEDTLQEAVARGVRQFVNLGSGYDTFSYRQPGWAGVLRIFELDHPATQREKRTLFAERRLTDPANLTFVPIDLEKDAFRIGMAEGGVDLSIPVWISCLGVLAYLKEQTVKKVFVEAAQLPKGSGFVFAFAPDVDQLGKGEGLRTHAATRAAEHGEPWLTRMKVEELERELKEIGFEEVRFLFPDEAKDRYFRSRTDLPAPRKVRLCVATV